MSRDPWCRRNARRIGRIGAVACLAVMVLGPSREAVSQSSARPPSRAAIEASLGDVANTRSVELPDAWGTTAELDAADALLRKGRCGEALNGYLAALDAARVLQSSRTLVADGRVEEVLSRVPDLSEAELDGIQSGLPAWDSLKTPMAKAWLVRFYDARWKKLALAAGDAKDGLKADAGPREVAARNARDAAWQLITEYPAESVIREAVNVYLVASNSLGVCEEAKQDLAEATKSGPPSVAAYCLAYWSAQGAHAEYDALALKGHCETLVRIFEQGTLAPVLNDPFGRSLDKLLLAYHVPYAYYVVGQPGLAVQYCDALLKAYTDGREPVGAEIAVLTMTSLVRAMSIAAANPDDPAKGHAAYDEFLAKYPDDPNSAVAWLCKGILHAQEGKTEDAAKCYEKAAAQFPDTESARDARARLDDIRHAPPP